MNEDLIEAILMFMIDNAEEGATFNDHVAEHEIPGKDAYTRLKTTVPFSQAGLMTRDSGLILKMDDGTEYCLTITKRK